MNSDGIQWQGCVSKQNWEQECYAWDSADGKRLQKL